MASLSRHHNAVHAEHFRPHDSRSSPHGHERRFAANRTWSRQQDAAAADHPPHPRHHASGVIQPPARELTHRRSHIKPANHSGEGDCSNASRQSDHRGSHHRHHDHDHDQHMHSPTVHSMTGYSGSAEYNDGMTAAAPLRNPPTLLTTSATMTSNHHASSSHQMSDSPQQYSETRAGSSFVTHSSEPSEEDEGLFSEGNRVFSSGSSLSGSVSGHSSNPSGDINEVNAQVPASQPQLKTFKSGYRMGQKAEQASTHRDAKLIASQVAAVAVEEHEETVDGFRAALQAKIAAANDEAYAAYLNQLLLIASGELMAAVPTGRISRRSSDARQSSECIAHAGMMDQGTFNSSVTSKLETSEHNGAGLRHRHIPYDNHHETQSPLSLDDRAVATQQQTKKQAQHWYTDSPVRSAHWQHAKLLSRPMQPTVRSQRGQQHEWLNPNDSYQERQQQQQHEQLTNHRQQQQRLWQQQWRQQQLQQQQQQQSIEGELSSRMVSTIAVRPSYHMETGSLADTTYNDNNRKVSWPHQQYSPGSSHLLKATHTGKGFAKTHNTAKAQKQLQRPARRNVADNQAHMQHDSAAPSRQQSPELGTGQKLNMSLDTICQKKVSAQQPNKGSVAQSKKRHAESGDIKQGCFKGTHGGRGSGHPPQSKKIKPGGKAQHAHNRSIHKGWGGQQGSSGSHGNQSYKQGKTHSSIVPAVSLSVPAGLNSALGDAKREKSTPHRSSLKGTTVSNSSSKPGRAALPALSGKHKLIIFSNT